MPLPSHAPASGLRFNPARLSVGAVLLLLALASSGVLVAMHFGAVGVPGCGPAGGCGAAASSRLGSVPVLGWPTSFLGAAYFASMLPAWLLCRGNPGVALRWMIGVGAAISLVLLGGLAQLGQACPYCLAAHACNLVFTGIVFWKRSEPSSARSWAMPVAAFTGVLVLAGLLIAEQGARGRASTAAEARLSDSTKRIVEATASPPATTGFTGRYRLGPEQAAVRVVVITDFQCPDCRKVEGELEALASRHRSLSISTKMFPLSTECNPHAPGTWHANACWAARAALAAGALQGADGYWRMHRWLFSRSGSFTEPELRAALPALGFDPAAFIPAMEAPNRDAEIKADIDEATRLGIFQTPMIFINGVELKGWNADQAVTRAVTAALAAAPAPGTPESDVPTDAPSKFAADWREAPRVTLPMASFRHWKGPADAPVTAVLFGDYQETYCAEADGLLRLFTAGPPPNLRYAFAHFPVDQSCNPVTEVSRHPWACRAAFAAEAAAALDGEEGFWRMHDWLMAHREAMDDETLRRAAVETGLDPDLLLDAMAQPFVAEHVARDARLAQSLGLRSVPFIFVNDRPVARWKYEAENVLGRIILEAAAGR